MGFKPYPGWRPYCLVCTSMLRMVRTLYGFQCQSCRNRITPELLPYRGP